MYNKLPILYYKRGRIIDLPVEDWFESNPYTIKDLKSEITNSKLDDLFLLLMDITSTDRVNIEVFMHIIGSFEEVGDSILSCNLPNNDNILHCIISYDVKHAIKIAHSISFVFKHKVLLSNTIGLENINIESRQIDDTLFVDVLYPLFTDGENKYTNQILIKYSSSV